MVKVISNIVATEAWVVDVQKVKKYLDGEKWNDFEWVKDLIDDTEKVMRGKKGLEYFPEQELEVDFDVFETFPPCLRFNGGSVCHDGDYILRCERDYKGNVPFRKNQPVSNVFYKRVGKKEFPINYIEL